MTAPLRQRRAQANGTLMARAPRTKIRLGVFCLVELARLELATPCLQTGSAPPVDQSE